MPYSNKRTHRSSSFILWLMLPLTSLVLRNWQLAPFFFRQGRQALCNQSVPQSVLGGKLIFPLFCCSSWQTSANLQGLFGLLALTTGRYVSESAKPCIVRDQGNTSTVDSTWEGSKAVSELAGYNVHSLCPVMCAWNFLGAPSYLW